MLKAQSLKEFTTQAEEAMKRLFNCEEARHPSHTSDTPMRAASSCASH